MAQTIALANQKGGVGKSTVSMHLSHALADRGKRVLAVDMDPQSSLSIFMGQQPRALDEARRTIFYALAGEMPLEQVIIRGNPALLPAARSLALYDLPSIYVLREALRRLEAQYDYILIDSGPKLDALLITVLIASDSILVPTELDTLAVAGLDELLETVFECKQQENPALNILGIVPTKYDRRTRHDRQLLDELRLALEPHIRVLNPIDRSTDYQKATRATRALLSFLPRSRGVRQYSELADYIINHE